MNVSDSAFYAKVLESAGWNESTLEEADLVMVNTCAVREASVHKMESWIGQLNSQRRRTGKPSGIGVIGCVPQIDLAVFKRRHPQVDFTIGTFSSRQEMELALVQAVDLHTSGQKPAEGKVTSYVPITYGCDSFCTYCIVPYTRGRLISRPIHEIKSEIIALIENGASEVILLGQNVNAYGQDRNEPNGFIDLLEDVAEIDDLKRIRFLTSHPKDMKPETIRQIKQIPKIAPYFHLPVQSGNDEILRRMNRGYTVEKYRELINAINEQYPLRGLTTDLIVGFPGETDEMFEDSVKLLQEVRFDQVYSAQYSKRPKTPAANFVEQTNEEVLNERINRIVEMQRIITAENARLFHGQVLQVLIEDTIDGMSVGMSGVGKMVRIDEEIAPGTLVDVRIIDATAGPMLGEPIEPL